MLMISFHSYIMKNDTSNIIDLDSLFDTKNKQETIVNTTQPIQVDWDEILTEWSYRCPKGYPTVIDGKFTERDEVVILNEILEDRGFGSISLPEAKPAVKKSKAVHKPNAFADWWLGPMKESAKRTKWFEMIPIVQALNPKKKVTVEDILVALNRTDLDWGTSNTIDIIKKGLKKLQNDPASIDYLNNIYLAGLADFSPVNRSPTSNMASIFGNKQITSFIWGKIGDFYKLVNQAPSEKGSSNKVFTADVILFWGVPNPFAPEIQDKIKVAVAKPKISRESSSVVELGEGKYMACVSLKAGHGRIGKLTQYFGNFVTLSPDEMDDDSDQVTQESFGDFIGDLWDKVKQSKIGQAATTLGSKVGELIGRIKSFFEDLAGKAKEARDSATTEANVVSSLLSDLLITVQDENKDFSLEETLQEGEDGPLICNSCMQDKIKALEEFLKLFLEGKALDKFDKKIKELSQQPGFFYTFEKIDTTQKDIKKVIARTRKVVEIIKKAKPIEQPATAKKTKCTLLNAELKRSDMKNLFFISANQNAIIAINNMLDKSFPEGAIESDKFMKTLLKLVVDLNVQSVFGKSGALPLVKFTGSELYELGTKQEFAAKSMKNLSSQVKNLGAQRLPVVGLKVSPSSGKEDENPYYYVVTMYTLYAIENNPTTPAAFRYAQIAFKANSGSKFTFVVEADKIVEGQTVLKTLKK